MSSREHILNKLRAAQQPLPGAPLVHEHLPMVPVTDASPAGLERLFVENAQKLGSTIYQPASEQAALNIISELWGAERQIMAWDFAHIPLPGLPSLIAGAGTVADARDAGVRVGITGAEAGLAATGSLVLLSGPGKPRAASLLPFVHIAVLKRAYILPGLESWIAQQRAAGVGQFRQVASALIISGPSRTADIAMQLTLGMHGPAELHIILV